MTEFCLTDYTLRGLLRAPRTYDELPKEFRRMRKAKGKLFRQFGYETGCEPHQFTIQDLCNVCKDLETFYKTTKSEVTKKEKKKNKNLWKKTKKYVNAIANPAARIITFCVRQHAKKNIKAMQEATRDTSFAGWSNHYITWLYENEKTLFKKRLIRIVEGEYENGKPLRSSDDVPIPDDILQEVIKSWENKHRCERKQRLHIDIWKREKRFDPVRTELLLKLAPNSTLTLCWSIPICVLENSLVEKRREEIKKDATIFYHEAQRKALKYYDQKSRVEDALVHYWWQKENMLGQWHGHPFDDSIVDTLRGYPPDNFQDMMIDYKRYSQRLFNWADNDNYYGDGPDDLYQWRRWQTKLRSDLNIFFEALQKWEVGVNVFSTDHAFSSGYALEGCSTLFCGTLSHLKNEYEEEEEEDWVKEMREEEIERLEELAEKMRGYGSD